MQSLYLNPKKKEEDKSACAEKPQGCSQDQSHAATVLPSDSKDKSSEVALQSKNNDSTGQQVSEHSKEGWFAWGKRLTLEGIFWYVPSSFITSLLFGFTVPVVKCVAHFYRSLNWHWFLSEYVHLESLMGQLKTTAAVLDPNSSLFESLKNVSINWNEQLTVKQLGEYVQISSFDELVKLRMLGQKGLSDEMRQGRSYEQRLMEIWNELARAFNYCVGFIQYKTNRADDVASFDQHQLALFTRDLIDRTNNLAERLPTLIKKQKETSNGLLVEVYELGNFVLSLCKTLEINAILDA